MRNCAAVRLAVALVGVCAAAARASVLFDDTAASVGGADAVSSATSIASAFTTAGATSALTANLLLQQTAAGTDTLTLYSNSAGGIVPSAPIATLTAAAAPSAASAGLVTWTGTGLSLTAGTTYWLVLSSTGGVNWSYTNSTAVKNPWAIYDVAGGFYGSTGKNFPYIFSVSDTVALTTVTLQGTDLTNQSSFAAAGHWSDGAAPSAGKAYVVGPGTQIRTVVGSGDATFGGGSLTLNGASESFGTLALFNAKGATVTVNNLTLNKGRIINNTPGSLTVAGSITLGTSGTLDSGVSPGGRLTVSAPIGGGGGLVINGANTTSLTGNNTYSGTTSLTGSVLSVSGGAASNLLNNAGGLDLLNASGRVLFNYTGPNSPAAAIGAMLAAGNGLYVPYSEGQIRATSLASGRVIGYGDDGSAVTVRITLPGDADLDGDVDFNDFLKLQTSFNNAGTRFDQGNFNYDGATDFNDFLLLQTNFGHDVSGATAFVTAEQLAAVRAFGLTVPEPASLAGVGLGVAGLLRRRRNAPQGWRIGSRSR